MPTSNNSNDGAKTASSGSSEGCSKNNNNNNAIDDKRRRRMESNRESARRSRQKKQDHLDNLIKQVSGLKKEIEINGKKIDKISEMYEEINAENIVLRNQKDKLAARLESLDAIIEIANVVNGGGGSSSSLTTIDEAKEDEEGSNLKPWQLPCPSVPIMASSTLNDIHNRFNF